MMRTIDLNADLGEDESDAGIERDLAIMKIVSSCNIACGGHAGSPDNMQRMLIAAHSNGVAAGAHPSYPDRENFGRRSIEMPVDDLRKSLQEQIGILSGIASRCGYVLKHIKPHGALYNDMQDREDLSELLVNICKQRELPIVGMAGSILEKTSLTGNVPFIAEAFIDRRYTDSARLVPRGEQYAVIGAETDRLEQGLALASGEELQLKSGNTIQVRTDTLCLHSDSASALDTARAMRAKLEKSGFSIGPVTIG